MSNELDFAAATEIAALAKDLTRALKDQHSHVWAEHAQQELTTIAAPGLRIVPVETLAGLTGAIEQLLKELAQPLSGSGLILLPDDIPISCISDFVRPFVKYGVSIEKVRDVKGEALRVATSAKTYKNQVHTRIKAQRSDDAYRG